MMNTTERALNALKAAQQFIKNGVELGFIRMPDADTPDSAHDTPRLIDEAIAALVAASAEAQPSQEPELESMTRMFHAACADLGLINEALGLDPDDGGAEPILDAIEELKKRSPQPSAPVAQEWITREQAMRMVATGLPTADLIKQAFSMGAALRLDQFSVDNLLRIAQSENVTAMRNALSNVARALKAERHVLTDGYVLMPRELTAENSAKAALSGEFAANIELQCHECAEVGEICEDCEVCGGSGSVSTPVVIEWDTIKAIYSKAVALLSTPQVEQVEAKEGWKLVAEHGNPPEGLYLAIYQDGNSFPIALLSYGDYEYYSEDLNEGDQDGMVKGFGWNESVDTPGGEWDSVVYVRDVAAYLPTNYDMKSLKEVRAMLAAPSSQKEGEQG